MKITAVLSVPYDNYYVVKVYRQFDKFHLPIIRTYPCSYLEEKKLHLLKKRFLQLNALLQTEIINNRIKERKQLYERSPKSR